MSNKMVPGDTIGELELSKQQVGGLSGMAFWFLDDAEAIPGSFDGVATPENEALDEDEDGEEEEEEEEEEGDQDQGSTVDDNRNFWETQHQLLQSTLCRTTSLETKIRKATKEALNEIQINGNNNNVCACERPVAKGGCRSCLMREVSGRLRNAGYNSAICKSKWRSSPDIPSGEHTFIDVIDKSSPKKGDVRVIIELNLRAEFEMARATEDYNRLVRRLPEVFIGKVERLANVIKILCLAAKKCMKEKKMHMGPWRKRRYMQAKWLSACKRTSSMPIFSLALGYNQDYNSSRLPKPKASMLTVDLLDRLPNMHCTAVEVV